MYLTQAQLADVLRVKPSRIAQWTRDETIPETWRHVSDGRAFQYAPVCVALGLLVEELEAVFGRASPATKQAVRAIAPRLLMVWQSGDWSETFATAQLTEDSTVEVKVPLKFLDRAKELLA